MITATQKVPAGYKQTEIGVIPADWDVKRLGEIADVVTGNTPPTSDRSNYGEDYFFVSPADLGKGKYILQTEKKLSKKGFSISRRFPKNSILFTCIGSTIGKAGIAPIELTSNQQINAILPNDNFSPDFLFYTLNLIAPKIQSLAGEQAVPIVNKTEFELTAIALPSDKTEQSTIATALSDTDALIEKLEKLIEKKKNIKQGAMQELLTCKRRLPGFTGKWEIKKVGDIGKPYGGLAGKVKADFGHGNSYYIPFMNIMSNPVIDPNYLDAVDLRAGENQNKAQKGDLFFNGSSETPEEIGMCSVLQNDIPDLYLNSFCFGFRLNSDLNTNGLFFSYYFRGSVGRQLIFSLAQGATRYNLSKTNFLKLRVPYPESEEQTAIAATLSNMDAEIEKLEAQLTKYQNLKQGMMQVLLTGKIRLPH